MRKLVLVFVLVVASVAPATALGSIDRAGPPLADAGLDQSVTNGTTVFLDGSGSRAPDGRLVGYEWRIETPSGGSVTPHDGSAARTSFVPREIGRYAVTLTVTDDDGETATDTLYVDVERSKRATTSRPTTAPPSTPPGGTTPPTGPPSTPSTTTPSAPTSTAPTRSPTVRGPRLVTGDRPLTGMYAVTASGAVSSVEWFVDGETVSNGSEFSTSWTPGDHTLRAAVTYSDGATEMATFEDGTTGVVADPRPQPSLSDVGTDGGLTGRASATDEYGNLQSVEVSIEDIRTERRSGSLGTGGTAAFDWTDLEPGREYEVVVTAVDSRGQTATVNRTVVPTAPPEVISAEFVDGPVDSYHPEIDPGRYTAHHVLQVDLNGHSIEEFDIDLWAQKPESVHQVVERSIEVSDGTVTIHSFWAGDTPSTGSPYSVVHQLSLRGSGPTEWVNSGTSNFAVTPSDPVIRLRMRNDGARPVGGDNSSAGGPVDFRETVIIDASDSFDPDGSDLTYIWRNGASATNRDEAIGRLSGWENGKLIVEDGTGARAYQNWSAQQTYVPSVHRTEVIGNGPYHPDETVQIRVRTQRVQFRRNTADIEIDAEVRGARGSVVEWTELRTADENSFAFEGTLELPASALAANGPNATVVLYNADRPGYAEETTSLPTVELTDAPRVQRGTLRVDDRRYVIRELTSETTVADTRAEMRQLRNGDYEVVDSTTETTGYRIEKRVQTQEEIIDRDTEAFDSSYHRRLYLDTHPEWTADGTEIERRRVANHHTEWKRSPSGGYTGDTRRVLVDPAEYVVEREYEYTTSEPRTRERSSYQCIPGVGCYEVTYDETVYVSVRHTYWAQSKQLSHHSATGSVRRTLVDAAEYATEYRHEYTTWSTVTERRYVASHTTVVQPARYEWRTHTTVSNGRTAKRIAKGDSDRRLGETVTDRQWTMERTSVGTVVRPAYTTEDVVVETRATVSGSVIRYRSDDSGLKTARVVEEFSTEFVSRGALDEAAIKERVRETEGER
ncbi:PKD domain-containing protein [Halomarina oriensis]|uniref:PKD domain-containing protein n=1 Tax=Halomarina oriensis TaxID=671145 RepID=A0A6B0GQQ5_9EURY|nr:PKD domain-containing protein [Halomarina oriensis]MWG33998.1 hypothetical protein [Halomarina oriensis]